jgi:hypothetical protein
MAVPQPQNTYSLRSLIQLHVSDITLQNIGQHNDKYHLKINN